MRSYRARHPERYAEHKAKMRLRYKGIAEAVRVRNRERYATDPAYREKKSRAAIKWRYRIDPAIYDELLEKQQGVCACCRLSETGKSGRLHVDHDHGTGRIRGLLCSRCNVALGLLRDNPSTILRLWEYRKGADNAGVS
jgi:hypothetical protein